MVGQRWATVVDGGPTFNRDCLNVFLGRRQAAVPANKPTRREP